MSTPSLDRYAGDFERLAALPPTEREAAIEALSLNDDERAVLRQLLEADADNEGDDALVHALAAGAERLATPDRDRLGAYRLLRELGAGGMGTVFLAERVEGGFTQQIAIKLLRGFPTQDGLRRLRMERQILASLDHPHIARLLDGGETDDGQPWLAIEYVDGLALLDYTARHAPRLLDRLALFDAVLDAVGHAHQRLVIHRDIKPANVLVNAAGEVKLLDFGIARLVDLDTPAAARDTSTRVYSLGYASPEQREGRAITTASDIYSLGLLLRKLVAGSPKQAATSAALPLDVELAGIIAKATDGDPAKRYGSAGEFRADLDRYRDGRPVLAARLTRRYRLRKFVGRHRLGVAMGLVGVMALGLFVWRLDHERGRAVAAEVVASYEAQRARAALAFLTDAFEAAAPDNALSATVSVRDLLDHARTRLAAQVLDPAIAKPLQRLLGNLYAELGDNATGSELLTLGVTDAPVRDREDALALAQDHDRLAMLEAMNSHYEAALAVVARGASLRFHYAPDDVDERARQLLALARVHHHSGENQQAITLLRQALESVPGTPSLQPALATEISSMLVSALVFTDECSDALALGEAELARAQPGSTPPVTHIVLLRSVATAQVNCGDAIRGESLYRTAIAAQQALIGPAGTRMSGLFNDLGVALSTQGRYREAAEALARANTLDLASGVRPSDYATVLGNRAALLESAGDYPQALALFQQAVEELDRTDMPIDAESRRRLLRNQARTLALAGKAGHAATLLAELRQRSLRLDGPDSLEYLANTWQLAQAERRAGHLQAATAHLREAEAGYMALLPPEHIVFAHAVRQHGALAALRGDHDGAAREFGRALEHMRGNGAAAIDTAIAGAELAGAHLALGRHDEARTLLAEALPVLRDLLLPTEVSRADAERIATALGLP